MTKLWVSKFVFLIGCLTIAFAVYATTFYLVRNKVVLPFERANFHETHTIRPVYNVVYYPMRYFAANGSSFSKDVPETYRGHLKKGDFVKEGRKGHRSAGVDEFEGNYVSIGFVASKSTLKAYDTVDNGAFVKLVLGRALSKEYDRFINKLIDVEVLELMADPRIKEIEYSKTESEAVMNQYRALISPPQNCAKSFIENYGEQVLQHCQQTGYAQNIGGGCYHIQGYSLHTAIFEQAVISCTN